MAHRCVVKAEPSPKLGLQPTNEGSRDPALERASSGGGFRLSEWVVPALLPMPPKPPPPRPPKPPPPPPPM
jgi:hypothetical protein